MMKKIFFLLTLLLVKFSVNADNIVSAVVNGEYRISQYYSMRQLYKIDKFMEADSYVFIEENEPPTYIWENNGDNCSVVLILKVDNQTPLFNCTMKYPTIIKDCQKMQELLYKFIINAADKIGVDILNVVKINCWEDTKDDNDLLTNN